MTDKQYFEKDINVPCKEQIMIDGVDVNRCIDFNKRDKVSCYHILYDKCNENPNCYFKQLARKTQECEKLKSQIETYSKMLDSTEFRVALTDVRTGEREVWRKLGSKADRYCKALEEIEKVCIEDTREFADGTQLRYDSLDEILDIINKAKG